MMISFPIGHLVVLRPKEPGMTKIVVDIATKPETLAQLRALGDIQVESITPSNEARELPVELIRDADILLCRTPPKNHAEMRRLNLIQLSSVGYAQLYGHNLVQRG